MVNNIGKKVTLFDGWGDLESGVVVKEHASSIDIKLKSGNEIRVRNNYYYPEDGK